MSHTERKLIALLLAACLACAALSGCGRAPAVRRDGEPPKTRDERGRLINNPTGTPAPVTGTPSPTVTPKITGKEPSPTVTPKITGKEPSPTESPLPGGRIDRKGYSADTILSYFEDIVLSAEYGDNDHHIHKWTAKICVYVEGSPTSKDRSVMNEIFRKMNSVSGFPGIRLVTRQEDANLFVYFYNDEGYDRITPSTITDKTNGFATTWYSNYVIYQAKIGIRTSMGQHERNSVLWEEFVQSTGMLNDSYAYPDSLFYQGYNEVQGPNRLDWLLFELLYHSDIRPGMDMSAVTAASKNIFR
ncbi:MAG: DUF2927 domain-containing protein [Lachnospiraceae bacterium]|nr:DUF2927 domain-containing protein [Lachnospiraceae bacterium]